MVDFTNNTIAINGYIQDNTKGYEVKAVNQTQTVTMKPGANDLMWFPYDGNAYTKVDGQIQAPMKHACAWITIKVIGDNVTGNNYLLKNLTINNLKHKGNVICKQITTTNEGQTTISYNAEWTLDNDVNYTSSEELYSNSIGAKFPKTGNDAVVFENYANNMIVLPQTPTTIDVTYSFVSQTGLNPITETYKNLSLAVGESDANKWLSGKHYIYTIKITATEILIEPEVSKWDDVPVTTTPSI